MSSFLFNGDDYHGLKCIDNGILFTNGEKFGVVHVEFGVTPNAIISIQEFGKRAMISQRQRLIKTSERRNIQTGICKMEAF